MKQFFRGSGIVVFFYTTVFAFVVLAVSEAIQIKELNIEYAEYWGAAKNTDGFGDNTDKIMLALCFVGVTFLLFVNIFDVTQYWVKQKRSEVKARIISGGTSIMIFFQLLINYIIVIIMAFAIGTICTFLILDSNLLYANTKHFFSGLIEIIQLSFLFMSIGLIIGAVSIYKAQRFYGIGGNE